MEISKQLSQKHRNKKIWKWENFIKELSLLRKKLKTDHLNFLGIEINLHTGETKDTILTIQHNPDNYIIYLFYYSNAKDTVHSGEWVHYYDLMEGLSKGIIPFQHSIDDLRTLFDNRKDQVIQIIEKIGGIKAAFGDISYIISPLPGARILIIYNHGDDEFPSELTFLFDKNIIYCLPPEMIWGIVSFINERIRQIANSPDQKQVMTG